MRAPSCDRIHAPYLSNFDQTAGDLLAILTCREKIMNGGAATLKKQPHCMDAIHEKLTNGLTMKERV